MRAADRSDRRLGWAQLTVRVLLAGAAFGGLAWGNLWGSDIDFPIGPMAQYAFWSSPDGEVADTYLEADTTAGTRVRVPLTVAEAGVNRAQVEGQPIRAHPELLAYFITQHARRHPDQPGFTRVSLREHVTPLHDSRPGTPFERTVGQWPR